jgi:hypothetical protein
MSDIEPRSKVSKNGVKGVGALAGGVGLGILAALSTHWLPGLIAGGVLAVVGFSLSGSKSDRTAGIVVAGAGIATAVAAIAHLSGLIWVPAVALIAAGAWSLFKFFRGVRSRS